MHPFYDYSRQLLAQNGTWWVGLVSMAMYLLFWAVVILLAYRFVRKYFLKKEGIDNIEDKAIGILRERYAKGEVDTEEFQRMLQVLKQTDELGGSR